MRILIISDGIPINGSLIGLFELDQAKALYNAGHEVILVAFDSFSVRERRKYGIELLKDFEFEVWKISIPIGRIPIQLCGKIASILFRKVIKKIICDHFNPDVVHAHFYFQGYIVTDCADLFNCPIIITEHSSRINRDDINKGIAIIAGKGYSRANTVIAVSGVLQKRIKQHFDINAIVVPNIVDIDVFYESERVKNTDSFCFVSTANLIPLKNMELLVRSFMSSFSINDDVKLMIFGDGPERSRLEKIVADAGYSEVIHFIGRRSRNEIAEYYKTADCFVLASNTETFGVAYVEAMASGLPVIATRCGGPEEFVNDECGILVDVGNESQLISALIEMRKKAKLYSSTHIANYAKKKFAATEIAEMLKIIYSKAIDEFKYDK